MSETPHAKKSGPPVSVGISSLFAVLIILCLTIFAVLARLTAEDERKLAEKASASVTSFYDAELRAVMQVAEIQSRLDEYAPGDTVAFAEEIDANRELAVELLVAEDGIIIMKWAASLKQEYSEPEEAPNIGIMEF